MRDGRLLVVGGGSIGERHIRSFLQAAPELAVELCEPRRARAVELIEKYPLVSVHPDFERIDLSRFEVAAVATPADRHVAQARRLVAAGCHVLVEKPLCVVERELRSVGALMAAAGRTRRVVGVAYTYRNYPQLREMARRVRAGAIGRPRLARASLVFDYARYRPDYRRNYFARAATGGGVVLDTASHALAFLIEVLGPAAEVQAATGRLGLAGVSVEDTAILTLRFRSGALAEVWASASQPRRKTEVEIVGPKGHIRWENAFEDAQTELAFTRGDGHPWERRRSAFDPDEPFVEQARNFLAAVAGREPVRTSLAEALHVQRICWAALRSARTGRRQAIRG